MKRLGKVFKLIGNAVHSFLNDEGFKLSASLSYYTVFALGPLLIIIISLAGIFFGREAVQGRIYHEINGLVGSEAAIQIQDIISNIQRSHATTAGAIIGGIVFIIGATGVLQKCKALSTSFGL